MARDLQKLDKDFEVEADEIIDKFFEGQPPSTSNLSVQEKRFVIKELALASRPKDIIAKLNEGRSGSDLPTIPNDFDIYYYRYAFAPLIDDISIHYATHLSRKFRFANRIARISELNGIAERVLDIINKKPPEDLVDRDKRSYFDAVKVFSMLINSIDEQMGKLKLTKIDVSLKSKSDNPQIDASDIRKVIEDSLRTRFKDQLPSAVDANFTTVTEYDKCGWGEGWTNMCYCRYHGEQCKVQTSEISTCPLFLNNVLLNSKEWLTKNYVDNNFSVRQLAELSGCKEVNDKVLDYVRRRLKDLGITRGATE
jgi:hypothetical protein